MIKVTIRSPGDKPWTRKTEISEFRTFTGCSSAGCGDRLGSGDSALLHRSGLLSDGDGAEQAYREAISAPLARNETGVWWRRHDEYDAP